MNTEILTKVIKEIKESMFVVLDLIDKENTSNTPDKIIVESYTSIEKKVDDMIISLNDSKESLSKKDYEEFSLSLENIKYRCQYLINKFSK